MGYYSEYRFTLGTDLIEELEHICIDLSKEFRRSMVFAGQLVFQRETLFTRSLHHETAFSIQRRLQFAGMQVIILPIRVWEQPGPLSPVGMLRAFGRRSSACPATCGTRTSITSSR